MRSVQSQKLSCAVFSFNVWGILYKMSNILTGRMTFHKWRKQVICYIVLYMLYCPIDVIKTLLLIYIKNINMQIRTLGLQCFQDIYIYIYSAVKRLIAINHIQNKNCIYIMCVYCVYLLCIYKYTNTHICIYLRKLSIYRLIVWQH